MTDLLPELLSTCLWAAVTAATLGAIVGMVVGVIIGLSGLAWWMQKVEVARRAQLGLDEDDAVEG